MTGLHWLDWTVIGAYFAVLALVVWWSSRKQETSTDYFLAGRNIGWFAIGASLFASNIGSEHLVGLAGSGAKSGVAMALRTACVVSVGTRLGVGTLFIGLAYIPCRSFERRYNAIHGGFSPR